MTMKNPCHPGRIVKEAITEGLGLTVTAAAEGLGVSRKTLSAIVNERAAISPEMAFRLEKGIGSTADAWLRMQVAYDLAQARKTAGKIKVKKLEPAA
jgi:addiction module HigA family antidote